MFEGSDRRLHLKYVFIDRYRCHSIESPDFKISAPKAMWRLAELWKRDDTPVLVEEGGVII